MSSYESSLVLPQATVEINQGVKVHPALRDNSRRVPIPSYSFRIGESVLGDRFQVVEHLHSNKDMGSEVFRAIDWDSPSAEDEVALKVIDESAPVGYLAAREQEAYRRFNGRQGMLVIRAMGTLSIGHGSENPRLFVASEYATQGSLDDVARRNNRNLDVILEGVSAIIDPLGTLHEEGLVHRDIKPDNILGTGESERIKWLLGDFGIIDRIGSPADGTGSLGFMAPECLRSDGVLSEKTDVYALAQTIYNAATGTYTVPTRAAAYMKKYIAAAMSEAPVSERDLPQGLLQLIDEATSWDPEDRPNTREFASGLKEI